MPSTEASIVAPDDEVDNQIVTPYGQLPFSFSKKHEIVLVYNAKNIELCHIKAPNADLLLEVRRVIGGAFSLLQVEKSHFNELVASAYQSSSSDAQQLMQDIGSDDLFALAEDMPADEDLLETEDDAPIIKLINALLGEAIKEEASDIHIETFENSLIIRFRIDGILREILKPQRKLAALLVSRIKVMAKLDIAEKRVPQDGRISLRIGGRAVDVRVSTMPASHGERVVLRILDKNAIKLDLATLGMTPENHELMRSLIHQPHGIVLVTGPTGSGKSTTLYAALMEIDAKEHNILTIEDPIEYSIEGIGQTQVNSKVEMTFARGLRAILRQDPDVVMIGEIRDLETAQIAVQASLTGHLVFSTLHTNSAVGAVTRLRDMGVEPFLLSSSLLGVLAQRLVRRLCTYCKAPHIASSKEKHLLGVPNTEKVIIYNAKGCEHCNATGYRGRMGIHELLIVTDVVRELMHTGAGEQAIEKVIRQSTPSIRHDGMAKVYQGLTTLEEIVRVTSEDDCGNLPI
ncbi:general secretory pathway protein E [Psychromonas sp. CNPT3]|uniref:type II secretion system ATPase GspE n=1 Tax=Psychromonas sp. CNPT3 TaxID=314282 RepID=UPI00006E709A|nr:type II secretion system ATPase GspE [Psychromonas sp. CNPT3]AGH80122.1 general secretory pathway protein E [Psychromonas sp. CNPT3]